MRLFISYAHADNKKVEQLAEMLESAGHTVWFDRALAGGENWWKTILENIEQTDVFIFVLTPQSTASAACRAEYQYGLDTNKPILPIMLEEAELPVGQLQETQFVAVKTLRGQDTALSIARALFRLSEQIRDGAYPKPVPMPPRPAFPFPADPLRETRTRIQNLHGVSSDELIQLVLGLKQTAREKPQTVAEVRKLLQDIRRSPDVSQRVAAEAADAIKTLGSGRNIIGRVLTAIREVLIDGRKIGPRGLMAIGAVVILIVVGIVAALLLNGGDGSGRQGDDGETREAGVTDSPTEAPTDAPTEVPTEIAADTPTSTPSPSHTPTNTTNPSPTNTASSTPTSTVTPSPTTDSSQSGSPAATLRLAASFDGGTFDPLYAETTDAITVAENLFLGLTNYDPYMRQIVPEAASSWEVNEDGTVWTFGLRPDIYWVQYDPDASFGVATGRRVTAQDFVFAIQRACDPRTEDANGNRPYLGRMLANYIEGCDVLNAMDPSAVTDQIAYGDTVALELIDDYTFSITLLAPFANFAAITTLPSMKAVPFELQFSSADDIWLNPETLVTNGPFVLAEYEANVRSRYIANPQFPAGLWDGGNIEAVELAVLNEDSAYLEYQVGSLDMVNAPTAEEADAMNDATLDGERVMRPVPQLAYFGFSVNTPPFDDVRIRRAFAAILDREAAVVNLLGGPGTTTNQIAPAGLEAAPAWDTNKLKLDPDLANQLMAEAGYPNCEGFPTVIFMARQGFGYLLQWWVAAAVEYLGCDPSQFIVQEVDFAVLIDVLNTTDILRPNAFYLTYGPDAPDVSFMYEPVGCGGYNPTLRQCSEVDDLLNEAITEFDPSARIEAYAQIERSLFGPDGEFPIIPLYHRVDVWLRVPNLSGPFETDDPFFGINWDAYTLQ